jgi:DNA-binding NarL/FixJ family response regulator
MAKPRVLLGDDHSLILEGMRTVLCLNFDIVGTALNGRDLVTAAEQLSPQAVLLDISMPILNGIEAGRQIKRTAPASKLVYVTQMTDRAYVRAAFEAGASAYVVKQCVATEIRAALESALAGYYYVSPLLRKGLPNGFVDPTVNPGELFGSALTVRQREVLQLVAEGKSNKEIASALNISGKTVEFHKAGLMDQLGLRTTAELTRYAIEQGVLPITGGILDA